MVKSAAQIYPKSVLFASSVTILEFHWYVVSMCPNTLMWGISPNPYVCMSRLVLGKMNDKCKVRNKSLTKFLSTNQIVTDD